MNIFIPSKNRCDTSQLLMSLYENDFFDITVIVEPQDYNNYALTYPKFDFLQLDMDNQGISYVRNFIKQYTETNKIDRYWQLDDDISNFYIRQNTSLIKSDIEILIQCQKQFIQQGIALGSLEYRQFAWSANKQFIYNSFCDTCVYVDNLLTQGMRYRKFVEGKEDRDFAMQVIQNNLKSARNTLFAFSCPTNGSNKGGLKEIFYDLHKEEECCKNMVELWGYDICQHYIKPDGRNDVKINWKKIRSKQLPLFL